MSPAVIAYLRRYVDRFGDVKGIAARVARDLLDLLTIARESVVLPLPSFNLKVVEDYGRFHSLEPIAQPTDILCATSAYFGSPRGFVSCYKA